MCITLVHAVMPSYVQVEDFLGDFLDDSFSTYAEDDSPAQV